MDDVKKVPTWRIIVAFILDFISAFIASGMLVAYLTDGFTDNGFQLEGIPALFCFALIAAYFFIGRRHGGTLWARFFKAVRHA